MKISPVRLTSSIQSESKRAHEAWVKHFNRLTETNALRKNKDEVIPTRVEAIRTSVPIVDWNFYFGIDRRLSGSENIW